MPRLLFIVLLSLAASAQEPPPHRYIISIGDESSPIASGKIWLYSYSWYGLQKLKLADIGNGRVVLPSQTDKLKRELDPHPNTEAYVLVVQVGEHLWYRTPDISPTVIWNNLSETLSSLGQAAALSTGETRLILPSPAERRITMLYPDGRPAANAEIQVSVYLYDYNHCGGHEGLPLGTFRTDAQGSFAVLEPQIPLFLDNVTHFEKVGLGPAGVAYSYDHGLKVGSEQTMVLKEAWELTDDDSRLDDFELHVVTATGKPLAGVEVYEEYRTNTCGGGDHTGTTDSQGTATIELIAETITALTLARPDGQQRKLTDPELHALFSQHKLTVRW